MTIFPPEWHLYAYREEEKVDLTEKFTLLIPSHQIAPFIFEIFRDPTGKNLSCIKKTIKTAVPKKKIILLFFNNSLWYKKWILLTYMIYSNTYIWYTGWLLERSQDWYYQYWLYYQCWFPTLINIPILMVFDLWVFSYRNILYVL